MFKKYKSNFMLIIMLLTLIIMFSTTNTFFFKWYNFKNILDQSTLNIIIGIGMTFVICTAGMDLSVGSIAAFSGVILALSVHSGIHLGFSIILALLVGSIIGFLNGLLISKIKINPFIVTLSSLSIWRALTLIFTKSSPIYGFPKRFTFIGTGSFMGIPITVILCSFVMIIGIITFKNTKLGYYALALGSNEEALRRTGVCTNFYKILIYTISGFLSALAGIILTSKLNCADPLAANMMEMDVIATVILGGTSIKGGKGTILGTLIAGLLLSVLRNGLTLNGIAPYYQQLLVGLIIIIAVILSEKCFTKN
ncbi:MAG: ABC transporter permease [Clostridium botulinum]|nr:ABC transporter permease [Clostridium botulinum]